MENPLWYDVMVTANEISMGIRGKKTDREIKLTPHQKNLYFSGLRKWGFATTRLKRFCKSSPPLEIVAVLAISCFLLLDKRYSKFTIVDQCVEAAKKMNGSKIAALVNFILRKTAPLGSDVIEDSEKEESVCNAPSWWINKVRHQLKMRENLVWSAAKFQPPLTLRISRPSEFLSLVEDNLLKMGKKIIKQENSIITVIPPFDICKTELFSKGIVSIQDYNAQKLVDFIKIKPNMSVLDACAAPGGKTFSLALKFDKIKLVSNDVSKKRLELLEHDLLRLGHLLKSTPKLMAADLTKDSDLKQLKSFTFDGYDLIVLDAPCSGSGVVRRHPEIPWSRTPRQLTNLQNQQSKILESCWYLLKNKGVLVYCVCSIFSDEGENQILNFIEKNKNAVRMTAPGLLLPSVGKSSSPYEFLVGANLSRKEELFLGKDGFFYAQIKKEDGHY